MTQRRSLALFATLVAGTAMAQGVSVSTTTIAQNWKNQTPGFSSTTYTPATEFVGIDATGLDAKGALSLHIYGWGMVDLSDQSYVGGKHTGDFSSGFLQYDFGQANAQLKAGRFTVTQGVGNEQVDGISFRTDLVHDLTVSGFAGVPVVFHNYGSDDQGVLSTQRNFMYGGRLAWRPAPFGEIGVDYLQDGTSPGTQAAPTASSAVYTRRLTGVDLKLAPCAFLDFTGRTVFDVAPKTAPTPTSTVDWVAEHDYTATVKLHEKLSVSGTFVERHFFAYYAGSTLTNLFNQNEQGAFKATGAKATWLPLAGLQVVGDVRRTNRDAFGSTTRAGGDLRWTFAEAHVLAGAGYHQVNAFSVLALDPSTPAYGLSHSEERVWAMAERGALSASLDAIRFHYTDGDANPNLHGKSTETAVVGSLGYKAKSGLKVSGDLTLEDTPAFGRQTLALARVEYRFDLGRKGDK